MKLDQMRNIDLLSIYIKTNLAADNCLRMNSFDAHGHFHQAKEIHEEILKRMHSPDVVKLQVRDN